MDTFVNCGLLYLLTPSATEFVIEKMARLFRVFVAKYEQLETHGWVVRMRTFSVAHERFYSMICEKLATFIRLPTVTEKFDARTHVCLFFIINTSRCRIHGVDI